VLKSTKIRIRGKWWRLEIKQLAPVKREGSWVPLYGLCNYETRVVTLNPQFDMGETLLHEITHACQPDLDEVTVEEIEDAHINAKKALEKLIAK